jgi:NAD(P)-dependent dehydrogenase (short-subunit alcohol dehydrogenase family)
MEPRGATIVITGAASGIGAAMARAFAAEGAARLWLADLDEVGVQRVSGELGEVATPVLLDVTDEAAVAALVDRVEEEGPLDLFCANAGIATGMGLDAAEEVWDRIWHVNVLAHVYAARACLPRWRERGRGHLLVTASAAGLLTNLGDAPYTATKHAAVGLAEWIAITHGDEGIGASCLCPQGVRTPMVLGGLEDEQLAAGVVEAMGLIEPEDCAAAVVEGLRADRFLILPHPEVARYQRNKAEDPERWIGGMRKLQRRLQGS